MKEIGQTQNGTLLLKESGVGGEWGLLVGSDKRIHTAIWWDTKKEIIEALEKVLEELK